MAPVLKTGVPERVPGVRIPPSPPDFFTRLRFKWRSFALDFAKGQDFLWWDSPLHSGVGPRKF
jgi:hypothetical protein